MENQPPVSAQTGLFAEAIEWLQIGGPVVMILLAMSLFALTVVLAKLFQFRAVRLGQRKVAHDALRLYRAGRRKEALLLARRSPNPLARVVAAGISGRLRPQLAEAKVREEVYRLGTGYLETLRAWLRPLEVIASLAPLLGLLGTVLGMIKAFQQLQAAGARVDPAVLSGGIWEALLTTAVGLAVAIPIVVVVNFLDRVLARLGHEMNDAIAQIFTEELTCEPEQEEAAHADVPERYGVATQH